MNKKNYLRNSGKDWSPSATKELKRLAAGNTPTGVIGFKLGRSKASIYSEASKLGVSLNPSNKSPYNRKH